MSAIYEYLMHAREQDIRRRLRRASRRPYARESVRSQSNTQTRESR